MLERTEDMLDGKTTYMFDRAHGSWRNIPNDTPEFLPVILRDRPGYWRLTHLLSILALKPLTWDDDDESARKPPPLIPYTEDEINKFCVEIISAIGKEKMSWLREEKDGDDIPISVSEQKDKLMDLASLRISERCGYAARGEITRIWTIPTGKAEHPSFSLSIREPPIAEDNLGLKTWGTSFAIAKKLYSFGNEYLEEALSEEEADQFGGAFQPSLNPRPKATVLELGSGTGLVGIAAAGVWGCQTFLSDLKEIMPNLLHNIQENSKIVAAVSSGRMQGELVNWSCPETAFAGRSDKTFDIILVSDPLYDDGHPAMLARNIQRFLALKKSARALVAVPMRDEKTIQLIQDFENFMVANGLVEVACGEEVCRDDWEAHNNGEAVMIKWIIWKWPQDHCS